MARSGAGAGETRAPPQGAVNATPKRMRAVHKAHRTHQCHGKHGHSLQNAQWTWLQAVYIFEIVGKRQRPCGCQQADKEVWAAVHGVMIPHTLTGNNAAGDRTSTLVLLLMRRRRRRLAKRRYCPGSAECIHMSRQRQ